jgi:hypothetical protein
MRQNRRCAVLVHVVCGGAFSSREESSLPLRPEQLADLVEHTLASLWLAAELTNTRERVGEFVELTSHLSPRE